MDQGDEPELILSVSPTLTGNGGSFSRSFEPLSGIRSNRWNVLSSWAVAQDQMAGQSVNALCVPLRLHKGLEGAHRYPTLTWGLKRLCVA